MEFAAEGGEGPTPYETLLRAALVGQSTRFTRQDSVEETWRVMQPLIDQARPSTGTRPVRGGGKQRTPSSRNTGAGVVRGSYEQGARFGGG
jgi:glucose-6-phosphate 1-dehydrogenase